MTKRVCSAPGCPVISDKPKCIDHRREHERARGSRHERGYGSDHDRERARWAPIVATGNVKCWRCGDYIGSSAAWDLGHDETDRSKYRGPEHVGRECPKGGNRATAGRISPSA